MKGKRKFRNVIAKILENFDVRVILGDDFSYDPETRTVYFTPFTCSVDEFHRQWILDFLDFTVTERDYFLTAKEALEYGLVDKVITNSEIGKDK